MDEELVGSEDYSSIEEEISALQKAVLLLKEEINRRDKGFHIDLDRLSSDVLELSTILANKPSLRDVKYDLPRYESLNELLAKLSGYDTDEGLVYEKLYEYYPKLDFHLNKNEYKDEQITFGTMFDNKELIKSAFTHYRQILRDSNFMHLPYGDKLRIYSPKDFKDIILSYYATFDDRIYKIAKRYFDEQRIEVVTNPAKNIDKKHSLGETKAEIERLNKLIDMLLKIENPTEEEMYQLEAYTSQVDYLEREVSLLEKRLDKDRYINLLRKLIRKTNREIDALLTKTTLTQEETNRLKELEKLFDDYDKELDSMYNAEINEDDYAGFFYSATSIESGYVYSEGKYDSFTAAVVAHELGHAMEAELYDFPQQKCFLIGPYYETSSQVFETGFENYLIDQKIDEVGGLIIKNSDYNDLDIRSELIEKQFDRGMKLNPKRKTVTTQDGRNLKAMEFIYAFGKYYAEHLAKIQRENPREFFNIYNNFISNNHTVSMEELISYLGISKEEFATCEIIKPVIEEDTKQLQRKLFKK